jgi:hypothetical protein
MKTIISICRNSPKPEHGSLLDDQLFPKKLLKELRNANIAIVSFGFVTTASTKPIEVIDETDDDNR